MVELLIAIVIVSLLLLVGWPRLHEIGLRSDVRSARSTVLSVYARGRAAAIEGGRSTTLSLNGTSAWITGTPRLVPAVGSTSDTVGRVENLFLRYGVAVSVAPSPTLVIDPRGFTSAGSTTIRVSKSGYTDSIIISGFGRVLK